MPDVGRVGQAKLAGVVTPADRGRHAVGTGDRVGRGRDAGLAVGGGRGRRAGQRGGGTDAGAAKVTLAPGTGLP